MHKTQLFDTTVNTKRQVYLALTSIIPLQAMYKFMGNMTVPVA
jgi:hypothetical protein